MPESGHVFSNIESIALNNMSRIAVRDKDKGLSYKELLCQVDKLTACLSNNNDPIVGVLIDSSVDLITAILSILKSGKAFLPLDVKLPEKRIQSIINDANVSHVVTTKALSHLLPKNVNTLDCSELPEQSNKPDTKEPYNDIAYVIYTSGSTGIPKGVCVTHTGLLSYLKGLEAILDVSRDEEMVWSFFSSTGADLGFTSLFGSLYMGQTLQLIPIDIVMDTVKLWEYLHKHPIDILKTVPSLVESLHRSLAPHISLHQILPKHTLLLGGEALFPELVRNIQQSANNVQIINHYGPSEATIGVLANRLDKHANWSEHKGSIALGTPIGKAHVGLIVDGRIAKPGEKGEIVIGGDCLAKGYLNNPTLTAEKFSIDHPITGLQSAVYHTNDIGMYDNDNQVVFVGRADRQVKIRGFRIELGEVESQLVNLNGVGRAVVLKSSEEHLIAFYIGKEMPQAHIRSMLATELPNHMIPFSFIRKETLPLTANGKVDYKALEAEMVTYSQVQDISSAVTETQKVLCIIFSQLLKIDTIGIEQNFFLLGCHSLMLTQAISRIRERLHKAVSYNALFTYTSISSLAEHVDSLPLINHSCIFQIQDRQSSHRPSFSQESLWFVTQSLSDHSSYNLQLVMKINGQLQQHFLEQSLDWLVNRHESLRIGFVCNNDQLELKVADRVAVDMQIERLQAVRVESCFEGSDSELLRHVCIEESKQPFDLSSAGLFRATLLVESPTSYYLLLTIHHIVTDGWSNNILMEELSQKYSSLVTGNSLEVASLDFQYVDYIDWLHRNYQSDVIKNELTYWQKQLTDAPQRLALVTDHPAPARMTHVGTNYHFELCADQVSELEDFCSTRGGTLFSGLIACFKILLWRYSGQRDIIVGTPFANRHASEMEHVVGLFVNSVALRSHLEPEMDLEQFIVQVSQTVLDALENQRVPFEKVVEAVNPARSLSYSPLFQVMFALQNMDSAAIHLEGLEAEILPSVNSSAKYELSMMIEKGKTNYSAVIEYSSDLFEHETIERMAQVYNMLLSSVVTNANRAINTLPMLSETQAKQEAILCQNTLYTQEPSSVTERFDAISASFSSVHAVQDPTQTLTYQALSEQASQLASWLVSQGVQKGKDVVGVMLPPGCQFIVATLAVLKSGGAFVPLSKSLPKHRIEHMLKDAKVTLVITEEAPEEGDTAAFQWITYPDAIAQSVQTPSMQLPTMGDKDLAYIIYTSGSTGLPKGVCISHGALLNLVDWHVEAFDVRAKEKASQLASLIFDAAIWECWPYLLSGGTVCFTPSQCLISPELLRAWIIDNQIRYCFMPTPLAETILSEPWYHTGRLKYLFVGGEKLNKAPKYELPFKVVNNYGPTENAVVSTSGMVDSESEKLTYTQCPSIGRPINGCAVYILDENLNLVPRGVEGEIYLSGNGLARGYTSARLTAQSFLPDPFSTTPGQRMYRTYDMARWLPNGEIEYLGRKDRQVKIRGMRIELGEIEHCLAGHPNVANVVVFVKKNRLNDNVLVACICKHDCAQSEPELMQSLRSTLKNDLPEYMHPTHIKFTDRFPLTPTGKVDVKHLSTLIEVEQNNKSIIEPRNKAERLLSDIWCQALSLENVCVTDNFFSVGGDSINSIRLSSMCRKLGLDISVMDIFQYQTIAELASQLSNTQKQKDSFLEQAAPAEKFMRGQCMSILKEKFDGTLDHVESAFYTTQLQSFMLSFNALNPNVQLYRDIFSCRIKEPLDPALIDSVMQTITQRHEVLRAGMQNYDGVDFQVIYKHSCARAYYFDLQSTPRDEQAHVLEAFYLNELTLGFDLQVPGLFRLYLHQLAHDEFQISLSFHHAILDGWSAAILMSQIIALFRQVDTNDTVKHVVGHSFAYFVAYERLINNCDQQRSFWAKELADVVVPRQAHEYFALKARSPESLNYVSRVQVEVKKAELCCLEKRAELNKIPLKSVLLAIHCLSQAKVHKQHEVITGVVSGGRPNVDESDHTLGLYLNTLPIRMDVSGKQPIEVASALFEKEKDLMPFQRFAIKEMESLCGGGPLYETKFNFTSFHALEQSAPDTRCMALKIYDQSFVGMLVNFNKHVNEDLVSIEIIYNKAVYEVDYISQLAQVYLDEITVICDHKEQEGCA